MQWQTDPSGVPVPLGSTPTAEPDLVAAGMTDHDVPALRQHLAEDPGGPQDAVPVVDAGYGVDAPDPAPVDEKAARLAARRAGWTRWRPGPDVHRAGTQ